MVMQELVFMQKLNLLEARCYSSRENEFEIRLMWIRDVWSAKPIQLCLLLHLNPCNQTEWAIMVKSKHRSTFVLFEWEKHLCIKQVCAESTAMSGWYTTPYPQQQGVVTWSPTAVAYLFPPSAEWLICRSGCKMNKDSSTFRGETILKGGNWSH